MALTAIATFGAVRKREGRKEAVNDMKEADYEHAEDIRDRVDRNLADELRRHDDTGWRD